GVGTVTVNGGGATTLTLDDRANAPLTVKPDPGRIFDGGTDGKTTSPRYVVSALQVTRDDTVVITDVPTLEQRTTNFHAPVAYQGIANLAIVGGASADTFDVEATAASTPLTIDTSAGSRGDTVNVTPTSQDASGLAGALTINGGGNAVVTLHDEKKA